MGQDAVVFKSTSKMTQEFKHKEFVADPETGQALLPEGSGIEIALDDAIVLSKHVLSRAERDWLSENGWILPK